MSYTNEMYDMLWIMGASDEEESSAENVKKFLSDSHSFRNFGESLAALIRKKMPADCTLTEKDYLKEMAKEKGISLARNTVNNWFDGVRPKKGEASREHMYKVAFALSLTVSETKELFKKVYFDKPFNMRRAEEFVYYYCLEKGYSYERAQSILVRLETDNQNDDSTIFTEILSVSAENFTDDEEVIDYISRHGHNFQLSNTSAKKVLKQLIEEIKGNEKDLQVLKKGYISKTDKVSYVVREIDMDESLLGKEKSDNKSLMSISTMLDVILGISFVKVREERSSIFKNAHLLQEIKNRFPEKQTFSKENPTYEELRKMIILLFSYRFWFMIQYDGEELDFDDYEAELDDILNESGLQTLYYGNPFDWLFLYCTSEGNERPLDLFRDLVQSFLYEE